MPVLGLGTFLMNDPSACKKNVLDAIGIGYRLVDTAQGYGNEDQIGNAIAQCAVPREELFITTKVWFKNYEHTRVSVEKSLRKLQTEYLDLVLLHWPFGNTYAAWRALEEMYAEGKIRAIGVSNYNAARLIDLIEYNKVIPAVNQIETNLISQQVENRKWMDKYNVQHQGYAPFGQGRMDDMYNDPQLTLVAEKYNKTVRQIVLRFQLQSGVIVIPKSVNAERMKENFEVFDFELTNDDMALLQGFDKAAPMIGNPENPEKVVASLGW